MSALVTFVVGLCLTGSALAQLPQDHLPRRQTRQKQFDHSGRQLEQQQQQLNRERFRAEQGGSCTRSHKRPGRSVTVSMSCARNSRAP